MAEPIISGAVRAQVVLAGQSGLARDAVVNTFHFNKTGAGALAQADFDELYDDLIEFYTVTTTGNSPISEYVGKSVSRGADTCAIKFYDLGTAPPRVPYTRTFSFPSFAGSDGDSLPREVAICLSMKALTKPGPRGRGRIYFGPLRKNTVADGPGFAPMPINALQESLVASALRLRDAVGAAGLPWQVYSRRDTVQHMHTVTSFWVDNEFDTQRRRGLRSTNRVTGS